MNVLQLPWLEVAIAITLIGRPALSRLRNPEHIYCWSVALIGATFAATALAWLAFYVEVPADLLIRLSVQPALFGRQVFGLDELNAPLLPTVALVHFLTALSTSRTSMRRYSFSWSMAAETLSLLTFSCKEPWVLIGLLAASTVPPFVELLNRGKPTRVYVVHMALFVGLLVVGWAAGNARRGSFRAGFRGGRRYRSWPRSSCDAGPCRPIAG